MLTCCRLAFIVGVCISIAKLADSIQFRSRNWPGNSIKRNNAKFQQFSVDASLMFRGGNVAETNEDSEAAESHDEEFDGVEENGKKWFSQIDTASLKSIWTKTPPITQAYLIGSVSLTILSAITIGKWPDWLHFNFKKVCFGQFWRLITPFLFLGSLDIFYPLTLQFVWSHMSSLEKLNYKTPDEYLTMLAFGATSLVAVYSIFGISTKMLGHNLASFLVYIWSKVFEGTDVNFMDIVTLKAELVPWFFCLQTIILEQDIPLADLIGIGIGHAYYYLKEKSLIKSPAVFKQLFNTKYLRRKYDKMKKEFE